MQILWVLPAAVPLFCVTVLSADNNLRVFCLFLVFLCLTLFLNSFSLTPPLSVPPLSLQHVPPFLSLCLYTPLLFFFLPSWQQCQSGQADRGKHSTGQSRGRSKGWRIDYVYVCVLNCPASVCFVRLSPFCSYATASNVSLLRVWFGVFF